MSLQYIIDAYNVINHPQFNHCARKSQNIQSSLADFIRLNRLSGSIKEMHGQLSVTSTPMQGTTVQLSVPPPLRPLLSILTPVRMVCGQRLFHAPFFCRNLADDDALFLALCLDVNGHFRSRLYALFPFFFESVYGVADEVEDARRIKVSVGNCQLAPIF